MYRTILFRLMESYFRRRVLYLLPIVVLLACGAAYLVVTKPKYMAQGILYVQKSTVLSQLTNLQPATNSWWSTPAQDTVNTLNELIQTDAFIRAIIQETTLEAEMDQGPRAVSDIIDRVRRNIWVVPQGNNQVLFASTYEEPEVAVQLVSGMIDSYIRWGTNGRRSDSEVALSFFNDLIAKYRGEVEMARENMVAYLEAHPDPLRGERNSLEDMEIARLQAEIDQAQARYISALDKEENARLSLVQIESETQQSYIVIDAPHIPLKGMPSRREMAFKLAIFGAVGAVFSALAVAGSALLDRSFMVPADVTSRLNLPLLAVIPDASGKRKRMGRTRSQPVKQKQARAAETSTPAEPAPAAEPLQTAGRNAIQSFSPEFDPTEKERPAASAG